MERELLNGNGSQFEKVFTWMYLGWCEGLKSARFKHSQLVLKIPSNLIHANRHWVGFLGGIDTRGGNARRILFIII